MGQTFSPAIHVTGDVVKDVAIYRGDRLVSSDTGQVAPSLRVTLGGAAQLYRIVEAAAGRGQAQFAFAQLSHEEVMKFPDELAVHTLWHLREGGLKKQHADEGKKTKPKKVWRLAEPLGYAPSPIGKPVSVPLTKITPTGPDAPAILVIDDAGLGFRSVRTKLAGLWPASVGREEHPQPKWIIHKMSHPVAQGDLWRELTFLPEDGVNRRRDNLIVLTSADELRRAGAAVSRGLSWERTLTELGSELIGNMAFLPLLQCARFLIVNLGCVGAVVFESSGTGMPLDIVETGRLVYDPTLAEGQWKRLMQDEECPVFGVLNAFTAAVAVHLLALHLDEAAAVPNPSAKPRPALSLIDGIKRGLTAIRLLRLRGHGPEKPAPGFPCNSVASVIRPPHWVMDAKALAEESPSHAPKPQIFSGDADAVPPVSAEQQEERAAEESRQESALVAEHGFQVIGKPPGFEPDATDWTLVSLAETPYKLNQPLFGLAHRFALYGDQALHHIPHARFGGLLSVDRSEMETLRSLRQMIEAYRNDKNARRPLCLAAFGPPGAGKSFGIKQIANEILGKEGKEAEVLEFNLSQYNDPSALLGAFHRVRDKVLQGHLPVVFWDEFDSQGYKWLQFLLAPMQDGTFQSDQLTHTLGKCVFVFAGATSWDFDNFGPVPQPKEGSKASQARKLFYEEDSKSREADEAREAEFRQKKGPDFISRLDGHINVLGPNQRMLYDYASRSWSVVDDRDITWPVRRAILLRSFLGAKKSDSLDIDRDLLRAFILVPRYVHGARSLEKIARALADTRRPFRRAYLPPPQVLEQHLDTATRFDAIHAGNRTFRGPEKLWLLAAAIQENYLRLTEPKRAPLDQEQFLEALTGSDPWSRATNLAAAARLPDILALAGLRIEEGSYTNAREREEIQGHITHHLHELAKEEHNLWMTFHRDNGWGYVDPKELDSLDEVARKAEIKRLKNDERLHTLLIPFDELPLKEQGKDHSTIDHYQDMADLIGCKITFMQAER